MSKIAIQSKFVLPSAFVQAKNEKLVDNMVHNGESVFVLIRECYIRDNLKSTFSGKDKEISVNISFEIKTGGQTLNSTLGTYSSIIDRQEIQIKDIVVLPLQRVSDYFTLTVNVVEENELANMKSKIIDTIQFGGDVASNIPIVGSEISTSATLMGELINLLCALSPEHVLLRNTETFIIDEKTYPSLEGVKYLSTGTLLVFEEGFTYQSDKFLNKDGKEEKPTLIRLQILKPQRS